MSTGAPALFLSTLPAPAVNPTISDGSAALSDMPSPPLPLGAVPTVAAAHTSMTTSTTSLAAPQPPLAAGHDIQTPQHVSSPGDSLISAHTDPLSSPALSPAHHHHASGGNDVEPNDDVPTNIYLTKLPLTATNEDLAGLVAGDGDSVLEVRVLKHPTSGQGRGQAFVKYTTAAGAKAAVLRYDGAPFMGNVLSVSPAFDSNRGVCAEFAPSGRVFIRGIPRHVTHSDLVDLISPMATVHGCTMHVDRVAGQPLEEATSKFAYTVVSDYPSAAKVVSALHQATPWPGPDALPLLARIAPRKHRDPNPPRRPKRDHRASQHLTSRMPGPPPTPTFAQQPLQPVMTAPCPVPVTLSALPPQPSVGAPPLFPHSVPPSPHHYQGTAPPGYTYVPPPQPWPVQAPTAPPAVLPPYAPAPYVSAPAMLPPPTMVQYAPPPQPQSQPVWVPASATQQPVYFTVPPPPPRM